MNWAIEFLPEADRDMNELDSSVKARVFKGIRKVSQNPLPQAEGGYGKPLGNKGSTNLTNLLKIKFKDIGIRVVYTIIRDDTIMKIIVISARACADDKVYKEAAKRRKEHNL